MMPSVTLTEKVPVLCGGSLRALADSFQESKQTIHTHLELEIPLKLKERIVSMQFCLYQCTGLPLPLVSLCVAQRDVVLGLWWIICKSSERCAIPN